MADVGVDSALLEASLNGNHGDSSEEGEDGEPSKDSTGKHRENGDWESKDESDSKPDQAETVTKKDDSKGKEAKKAPGKKRQAEIKEPVSPFIDRPVRERKSIDRFVASAEKEKVREFKIEKGGGTFLKDIPNVVFKLSKKKGNDESVQLLHKFLYGKRVKPNHAKQNIFQFSGYVWGSNQEKEKTKLKERLDKNKKESLFQVAETLDINFHKSEKKEDIVAKLLAFLESPHKTRDKLLEDIQQTKGKKSKAKKRKIKSQKASGKESSGQTPRKKQKSESTPSKVRRPKEEPVETEDDEAAEPEEHEEHESDQEEEPGRTKRGRKHESDDEDFDMKPKKSKRGRKATKKKTGRRDYTKEASSEPEESEEENSSLKKRSIKSPSKPEKAVVQSPGKEPSKIEASPSKVFSRKKKKENDQDAAGENVKETSSKENQAKAKAANRSAAKVKEKAKPKPQEAEPSDDELRSAICDLLKEADFSKVTFSDVLTHLEKKFKADLSEKKGHVKVLIREEINKIAEEDDGANDAEEEEEKKDESDTEGSADQDEDANQDEED